MFLILTQRQMELEYRRLGSFYFSVVVAVYVLIVLDVSTGDIVLVNDIKNSPS